MSEQKSDINRSGVIEALVLGGVAVLLWIVMPRLVSNPEEGMFFLLLPGLFFAAVGLYVFLDAVNLFGGPGSDAPAQVTLPSPPCCPEARARRVRDLQHVYGFDEPG